MKSTIVIAAIVGGIALLANIGTIIDNACKYLVTCSGQPDAQLARPRNPEAVIICKGQLTKLPNGIIICEPQK